MGSRLDRSIKIFVNAIEAAKLFIARRALMLGRRKSSIIIVIGRRPLNSTFEAKSR
jgi:hypothetical protein